MASTHDRARGLLRGVLLSALAGLALAVPGCGDGRLARTPVTGSVWVAGKPAAGAIVMLHPAAGGVGKEAEQLRPTATCGRDGRFVMGTWELADGVPAGRWKATVQWFVADSAAAEADPETAHLEADRLGNAYADPETTPLEIEVADAALALEPFDLRPAPTGAR